LSKKFPRHASRLRGAGHISLAIGVVEKELERGGVYCIQYFVYNILYTVCSIFLSFAGAENCIQYIVWCMVYTRGGARWIISGARVFLPSAAVQIAYKAGVRGR
jgi:hypothetical protein